MSSSTGPATFLAPLPLQWSAGSLLADAKPEISGLIGVWRRSAGDGRFPGRASFGPVQLKPVLPCTHVYQVAGREPPRFVIRLVGTRMTDHIGRNLAGRPVEEVPVENLRLAMTALLNAVLAAETYIHVKAARALGLPEADTQALESVWLPCAEDGETIDRIIAITLVDETT